MFQLPYTIRLRRNRRWRDKFENGAYHSVNVIASYHESLLGWVWHRVFARPQPWQMRPIGGVGIGILELEFYRIDFQAPRPTPSQ